MKYLEIALLAIFCFLTVENVLASNATMPKAAPPIQRQAQERPSDSVASFRVQTEAASTIPTLNGKIDTSSGTSADGVIKTKPSLRGSATQVPPEMFRAWLEQAHPRFAMSTSSLAPSSVLEVKGVYDNAGKTLHALGLPFERISGGDIADMPLNDVKVIVVDCPGRVPRKSFQRLRDFVAHGGYLLTTDWSSDNVIDGAFPGYIQWDNHTNKESVYDAEITEIARPDPSLFARTVSNATWKMDIDSHMIRVQREDVRVLAVSRQLSGEDSNSRGVLAVVFPFGRGYVLHMVGHFDNNTILSFRNMLADPAPVIGISLRQAIATNFVVAGLSGTHIPIH